MHHYSETGALYDIGSGLTYIFGDGFINSINTLLRPGLFCENPCLKIFHSRENLHFIQYLPQIPAYSNNPISKTSKLLKHYFTPIKCCSLVFHPWLNFPTSLLSTLFIMNDSYSILLSHKI